MASGHHGTPLDDCPVCRPLAIRARDARAIADRFRLGIGGDGNLRDYSAAARNARVYAKAAVDARTRHYAHQTKEHTQ